jgi:hypothetical protein
MEVLHMHDTVIIIGSGPAGLTAALYAARANLAPLVIRGLAPGGLIATTDTVENYPGFPDAINGFDPADKLEKQAARFGTRFIDALVESVRLNAAPRLDGTLPRHAITLDSGDTHTADTIIIATGASPRKLDIPGEQRLANRGVSYCATCDGFFFRNKRIIVVGGGNSAVEEGLFLTRFAREVVVVHRRAALRADPISRHAPSPTQNCGSSGTLSRRRSSGQTRSRRSAYSTWIVEKRCSTQPTQCFPTSAIYPTTASWQVNSIAIVMGTFSPMAARGQTFREFLRPAMSLIGSTDRR